MSLVSQTSTTLSLMQMVTEKMALTTLPALRRVRTVLSWWLALGHLSKTQMLVLWFRV